MFINFSPLRVLFIAFVTAIVGAIVIDGSIYHSYKPTPMYETLVLGVVIELIAAWTALTAIWYVFSAVRTFFRRGK